MFCDVVISASIETQRSICYTAGNAFSLNGIHNKFLPHFPPVCVQACVLLLPILPHFPAFYRMKKAEGSVLYSSAHTVPFRPLCIQKKTERFSLISVPSPRTEQTSAFYSLVIYLFLFHLIRFRCICQEYTEKKEYFYLLTFNVSITFLIAELYLQSLPNSIPRVELTFKI